MSVYYKHDTDYYYVFNEYWFEVQYKIHRADPFDPLEKNWAEVIVSILDEDPYLGDTNHMSGLTADDIFNSTIQLKRSVTIDLILE